MKNESIIKALTTVEEMFDDRGYIPISNGVPEPDIIKRMNCKKFMTPSGKYAFVTTINSTSHIAKHFAKFISDSNYETIFFIYTNNINLAHTTTERNLNYKVEIWSINSLQKNVSRHFLQPKIERVNPQSIGRINGKLPKIQFYDPLIRYYRFKHKDVVKITDKQGFINYRIVV